MQILIETRETHRYRTYPHKQYRYRRSDNQMAPTKGMSRRSQNMAPRRLRVRSKYPKWLSGDIFGFDCVELRLLQPEHYSLRDPHRCIGYCLADNLVHSLLPAQKQTLSSYCCRQSRAHGQCHSDVAVTNEQYLRSACCILCVLHILGSLCHVNNFGNGKYFGTHEEGHNERNFLSGLLHWEHYRAAGFQVLRCSKLSTRICRFACLLYHR
jgi:hypothetical protein